MAMRALGAAFFVIGALGIVVPLLPTTIFWLLAALCWAKSAPALHARLLAAPRVGPALRDWFEERAISRRGKAAAIGGIGVGWLVAFVPLHLSPLAALALGTPMLAVAAWIHARPEPRRTVRADARAGAAVAHDGELPA